MRRPEQAKTEELHWLEIVSLSNTKYALLFFIEYVKIYALFVWTLRTQNLRLEDQNRFQGLGYQIMPVLGHLYDA